MKSLIFTLVLTSVVCSTIAKPFQNAGVTKQELIDKCHRMEKELKDEMDKHPRTDANKDLYHQLEVIAMTVRELEMDIKILHKSDDTLQYPEIVLEELDEKMHKIFDELDGKTTTAAPTSSKMPFASGDDDESNEEILKHAQEMIDNAKKAIEKHSKDANHHINIAVIKQEIITIEDLMKQIKGADNPQQLAVLKANLELHEGILDSWVKSLDKKTADNGDVDKEAMLKHAQEVIDNAKKAVQKHAKDTKHQKDIKLIYSEIYLMETYMDQIQKTDDQKKLALWKQILESHEAIINLSVKHLDETTAINSSDDNDESNEEILKHAQEMIDNAKKAIEKHSKDTNHSIDIDVIKQEISTIENLMAQIKGADNPQQLALLKDNLKLHEGILDAWVKDLEK